MGGSHLFFYKQHMVLIYPSQGGCGDSWHVGDFKFQRFSWVLVKKKNCRKDGKGNYLEQSLNHEEHHGWIGGSSTGLPGDRKALVRPSQADMVLVFRPEKQREHQ